MTTTQFKATMWTELDAESIRVIAKCVIKSTGHIETIQLKHPKLARALWFSRSRSGNWYWRKTGRYSDTYADGYIIKGYVDGLADCKIKTIEA